MTETTEYPTSPFVELFGGRSAVEAAAATITAANAKTDPERVFLDGIMALRTAVIGNAQETLVNAAIVNDTVIRKSLDLAWQAFLPKWIKFTGPSIAEAYFTAFREAQAGQIPAKMVYALAEEHATRVAKYFNDTSTEAVIQGFNTYVNRQVPAKAALARVLHAYGMTPKQMSGFTSAKMLQAPSVDSSMALNPKRAIQKYVANSLAERLKVFNRQESHNLSQQAQQVAWMWMVDHGQIPADVEKIWLTAEDEKVCPQCGPMNKKRVGVNEKFELPNGNQLYVPGAHVNCRCRVRLWMDPETQIGKSYWIEKSTPRPKLLPVTEQTFVFYKANRDGDGDGYIDDGKPTMRRAPQHDRKRRVRQFAVADPVLDDLAAAVKERRKQDLAEQIDLTVQTAEEIAIPTAEDIAVPTVAQDIAIPETRSKEQIAVPKTTEEIAIPGEDIAVPGRELEEMVDFNTLVGLERDRQTAYRPADLTMQARRRRNAVPITGKGNEPGTGYVVDFLDEGEREGGIVRVPYAQDIRLLPQAEREEWLTRQAREAFDAKITQKLNELMLGNEVYQIRDQIQDEVFDDEGNPTDEMRDITLVAEISREDMYEMLKNIAFQGQAGFERLADEPVVYTEWVEEDPDNGEYIDVMGEHELSYSDVAEFVGVTPDEMRVVIMEIDEGHSDAHPVDPRSREVWKAPGAYEIARRYDKDAFRDRQGPIPILRAKLRPLVQEETYYEEVENPWLPNQGTNDVT